MREKMTRGQTNNYGESGDMFLFKKQKKWGFSTHRARRRRKTFGKLRWKEGKNWSFFE